MKRKWNSGEQSLDQLLTRCEGAYSQNTLRGYRNALEQFRRWCALRRLEWLPATSRAIAEFVDDEAKTKAMATVKHRLDAIRFAHMMADLPCPTQHSEVRLAVRRARRKKPARQDQVLGLTTEMLARMIEACPETMAGRRDAALIRVGYDTLCRSSELVLLQVENLSDGFSSILVPRAKSDPFGEGRIAYLSNETIENLKGWLEISGIEEGPLFRGLHTRRLSSNALTTPSIRRIVKRAASRAGLSSAEVGGLSGHSMRVGAAQDMLVAGIDTLGIMQAGGWKSQTVLARYVENASTERIHHHRWKQLAEMRTVPAA
ncbi:tyrosine-type recombinase/integrase [Qipengyuania citrea]|uniref:tyrosine-type recombinase/integrase n=1 Tax=Qipengyuania citrea TaxID=225971 RepID=UPI003298BDC1